MENWNPYSTETSWIGVGGSLVGDGSVPGPNQFREFIQLNQILDASVEVTHNASNEFIELGPNKTRWESTCSYELKTLFMTAMALIMSGRFKKQNMKFLENFKAFAETGVSVSGKTS